MAQAGSVGGEAMLVEVAADYVSGRRPMIDVELVVREHAAVIDQRPNPLVALGPAEQPTGEGAAVVVVPGRVLADHERPPPPPPVEAPEGGPHPRGGELRVDVRAHPVDKAPSRPVVPGLVCGD